VVLRGDPVPFAAMKIWQAALSALVVTAALTGCPDRTDAPPAGADQPRPTTAAETLPPAPLAPDSLSVVVKADQDEAGLLPIAFDDGVRPLIEPTTRLIVETNLGLRNYRIMVFDEIDKAMISDDTAELGSDGLRYEIVFHDPLKAGHRYTLVLDAATGTSLIDHLGRDQPDHRLEFQISGEKQKPAPPPKASAKGKKKRSR
jgi:hypothetical protein